MPRVIDIQRRHMELGRIRLGEKGAKGQPTRLDTWRLTSASRDLLESAAAIYGGSVEEWTDAPDKGYWQVTTDTITLDVIVPPGDPYSQFYELWSGGGCKRRCNGTQELITDTACKCDPEERECKITTRINVMLPRVAGLGVWRLESHGYYAAAELPDALDLLQQISGGRMVGGLLRIEQRSSKKDGRTNRYPVPVLDLPNVTLASLIGNQVVVNAPVALESGKPPLLDGPSPANESFQNTETPSFGEPPALPDASTPRPAPATESTLKAQIVDAVKARGLDLGAVERAADEAGVPAGQRATVEQLRAILSLLEQPSSGVPTVPADSAEAGSVPVSADTPDVDVSGSTKATAASSEDEAVPPGTSSEPSSAPTLDDVLAASGGELIPEKPGTDAYKALGATERATARAWWQEHDKAQDRQESLAEALGAPS